MQILEDKHRRAPVGDVLEEPSPGREQLLAFGGRRRFDTEQWEQPLAEPCAALALGKYALEFGLGDGRGVGLQDPGMGLEDLSQRPIRDALSVREASPLAPDGDVGRAVEVRPELGDDPALPDPGFADDGDELDATPGDRLLEYAPEDREVHLATDEWGVVRTREVGAQVRTRRDRMEDADGLGLAFEGCRRQLLVVEDRRCCLVCGEAHRDTHLRGDRLDPRRGIDRIAGEQPLSRTGSDAQAHQRLTTADADPEAKRGCPDAF